MKNKRIIYIIFLSSLLYCNNIMSNTIEAEGNGNIANNNQNIAAQKDNIITQNNVSNNQENYTNRNDSQNINTDQDNDITQNNVSRNQENHISKDIKREQTLDDDQAAEIENKKVKNNSTGKKDSSNSQQYHEIAQKNLQQVNAFLRELDGHQSPIEKLKNAIVNPTSHITPSTILHILSSLQFPEGMNHEMNPNNKDPKELFLNTHVATKYINITNLDQNVSSMSLNDWILKYDELYQKKIKENTTIYDKDLHKLHNNLKLQLDGFLTLFNKELSVNQNQVLDSFEEEQRHLSELANRSLEEQEIRQEYIHENESVVSTAHKASIYNSKKNKETQI